MPDKMRKAKPIGQPARKPQLSAWKRGYDSHYRELREVVLSENPFCAVCEKHFAVETHHLRYGPNLTTEDLLPVCIPCHNELEREKRNT